MDLTFTNNSAEFHADSHFNIHIEGAGSVALHRRTSGTGWDFVANYHGNVIDEDVVVNIPKDYRVICTATPTVAVVTFNEQ